MLGEELIARVMKLFCVNILPLVAALFTSCFAVNMLQPEVVQPTSFQLLRTSSQSALYSIVLPNASVNYAEAPLLLNLRGSRHQIGYDYAALLHQETQETLVSFVNSVIPDKADQGLLFDFVDYLWEAFLVKYTPTQFLEELEGMREWHIHNGGLESSNITTDVISRRFYTLANLPADAVNIISMLEQELEQGWPTWLKDVVNDLIRILEKIIRGCDAYGVWGSRTKSGLLHSSRNLDYNSNKDRQFSC